MLAVADRSCSCELPIPVREKDSSMATGRDSAKSKIPPREARPAGPDGDAGSPRGPARLGSEYLLATPLLLYYLVLVVLLNLASDRLFRAIFDLTDNWLYWLDADRRFRSRACGEITGHPPESHFADPQLLARLPPGSGPARRLPGRSTTAPDGEEQTRRMDCRLLPPRGETRYLHLTGRPIRDKQGHVVGLCDGVLDLSREKAREEVMPQQSKHTVEGEMLGNIAHQWRQPIAPSSCTCPGRSWNTWAATSVSRDIRRAWSSPSISRRAHRTARSAPEARPHSMFCTCSRICSMSTFSSTEVWDSSRETDLEPRVLASRCSSCIRKSRRLPAAPPA